MANFPAIESYEYPVAQTPATPDVLISKHRDGSEQRRLKGAGPMRRWELNLGAEFPMEKTERDAILAHFAGQNGMLDAFLWDHPETAEQVTVRYDAEPTEQLVAVGLYSMAVVFQEVPA